MTNNDRKVGVVGLGLLGTALAERLIGDGFDVFVFNRSREKSEPLLQLGATWSDNPFKQCPRVVVCLYTSEVVKTVLDQFQSELHDGHVIVDTTTGIPEQAIEFGESFSKKGIEYLEAPIAASSEQTRRGEAISIVAGKKSTFDGCQDIFGAIAPKRFYVGSWGNAAKTKLVNNLILGLNRAVLAEGLMFAKAMGLPMSDVLETIKKLNCYSAVMDTKGKKMVDDDFSLQAKLSQHLKDVRLIIDEAEAGGLSLPFSNLHRDTLQSLENAGHGELDNSAIIKAFEINSAS